ncbi:hypothetical protein [Modicisalibacter muralis]|nr:hypothetical protein [Halomonas muralis]
MRILFFLFFLLIAPYAVAGKFSDYVGTYWPYDSGQCGTTILFGKSHPDLKLNGVCIPASAVIDTKRKKLIPLAIAEMKNPQRLDEMIQIMMARSLPTEAYRVEIEDYTDDIFVLVDGSVLKKTDYGYVGYLGFQEDAILFQDGNDWNLCVDGDMFEVELLSEGSAYYGRDSIDGKSAGEIESLDICG